MAFHWRQAERALDLDADRTRRAELFAALSIDGRDLGRRPWAWSRGMQQHLVIAMALLGAPDLIVLDEPTSALDPVVAAGTMNLLDRHLAGRAKAMLLVTHDLGLAARRVACVLVMEAGHVVEDAATGVLLAAPRSSAARSLVAHCSWAELPC